MNFISCILGHSKDCFCDPEQVARIVGGQLGAVVYPFNFPFVSINGYIEQAFSIRWDDEEEVRSSEDDCLTEVDRVEVYETFDKVIEHLLKSK